MKSSFNLDKYIYSANKQVGEILEICVRPINFRIPTTGDRTFAVPGGTRQSRAFNSIAHGKGRAAMI
jgi:hypothetical protein